MQKKALGKGLGDIALNIEDKKKKKPEEKKKKSEGKNKSKGITKDEILQNDNYQVYLQAVTKVYKNGSILPDEETVLESMRDTLEIPKKVHDKILRLFDRGELPEVSPSPPKGRKMGKGKPGKVKKGDSASETSKGEEGEGAAALSGELEMDGYEDYDEEVTDEYKVLAYKKALELTLADGIVTDKEWTILSGLRDALGVTIEEHTRFEEEVREKLQQDMEDKRHEAERTEKRKIAGYRNNEDKIINFEKQVIKTGKSGVDISEPLKHVEHARDLLEQGLYQDVKASLAEARKGLTLTKKNASADKKIERLEQMAEKAQKLGADTLSIQERIGACRTALHEEDYGRFDKDTIKLRNELQNLLKGKGSIEQIRKTEELLEKVKQLDMDCTGVEKLIAESKKDLESGNYSRISKKMTKARKTLRDLERLHKSTHLIKEMSEEIESIRARDIDVSLADKLLEKAKGDLEAGKFPAVTKAVKEIKAAMKDAEKMKESLELINEVETLINEVREMGAKVTSAENNLKKAKGALNRKNYRSCARNANLARKSAMDARENIIQINAKNTITAVQLLISEADKFGADITESKQSLQKAEEMYANNDFSELDSILKRAEDLTKASLEAAKDRYLYEKVSAEFASIEDMIKETKKKGVDVSQVEDVIQESEQLLDIGKYEELETIIQNARESTTQALHKFQVSNASESINTTESLISEIKELGLDVNEAEDLLKQAESLFVEEDFDALDEYLFEADNIARLRMTEFKAQQASDAITMTQGLIAEGREHGLEVTEAEKILVEAESLFNDEDYDAVEDYVKRAETIARTSLEDYQATYVLDTVKDLETKLKESQAMGADVSDAQAEIEKAKASLKDKDYDNAESILRGAEEKVNREYRERKRKETEAVLTYTQKLLSDAKDTGADTGTAEEIYNEAKQMFDADELEIGVIADFAKKAETEVQEVRQRHLNTSAKDAINTTESLIREIKDIGADVSEAEDLLMQAEGMFKEDDFSTAEDIIKKAESSAVDSRIHFLSEKLSNDILITQRVIMDIKDMGGDVTAPMAELEKASKAIKDNDFDSVERNIESAKSILDEIKEKQVVKNSQERIKSLERSMNDVKNLGLDLSEVEVLLNEARSAMDTEDYKELNQKTMKAEEMIESAKKEYFSSKLSDNLDSVQKSMEDVVSLGSDVGQARTFLDRAKSLIDEGNFSEAESLLGQAQESVESKKKDFFGNEWQNSFSETKAKLTETRQLGGDTADIEQVLGEAESLAKEGEFVQAREKLSESSEKINELYETKMVEVSEKSLENLGEFINKTRELGVDLTAVDEMVTHAKEAVEQKEFETAKSITGEIDGKVKSSRTEFIENRIDEELSPIKKDLESARDIGAIVSDAEEYIDTAVDSFQSGEFDKALKFTERAKNFVIRAREKVINENHPKIDVKLLSTEFQDSNWNKLILHVENNGVIDAKDFRVIFSGDDLEFREPPTIPLVKVGQQMEVEVGVKPNVSGEIPMNMKYFYYRDFDDNEYISEDDKQFNVKPQGVYIIEDVFLTYQNGLLIAHETRKLEEDMQEDVFTSMLAAVQDFVKDSFYSKSKLDLNRLDFGDSKILLEKGNHVSLAVVIIADEPSLLPLFMREIIREIEETYMDVLDDWNGVMDELEGTNEIIRRLLEVSMDSEGDLGSLPASHVSTIYNLSKNIKNMGGDPADMDFLLESAIKSGSDGDFSSAWEYLDQAEEKGKVFMSEAFVESKKIIENAQETGINVGESKVELEDAQKHFRNGNYEAANKILEKTTVTIRDLRDRSQKAMFNEQITIFEESLTEMESQGVDISGPKAYLLMAKSAFDEGDYSKIENFLAHGQDEFISLKDMHQHDQVTQSIDRAESILTKVKEVGIDDTSQIEEIVHMLERARTARDEDDFDSAVEYATKARAQADTLIEESNARDAAKDAIDSTINVVSASKGAGVDVGAVEDILLKSRKAFENGDYLTTQEYTTEVQGMLEKLREPFQTQIASNAILNAQTAITETKEFGANVHNAENILKEAKTLFESEEFEKAEMRAMDAIKAARVAKREKQAELMKTPMGEIRVLISNISSIGADVSSANEFLKDAEESLNKLDLEMAEELMKRAENAAEDSRDKYLMDIASEAITISEKQIDEEEARGVDITDAKRMLNQAMEMFEDHEYIKAEQYASNATDLLEELKVQFEEKKALELYKNAKELIKEIQLLGADVSNAQVNLKLAEEAYTKQDNNLLQTHAQNAIDILMDMKKPFQPQISRDMITAAEKQIIGAQAFGVDVSEAEQLLVLARTDVETQLWDEAEIKAKQAKEIAESGKTKQYQSQITTEINELRANVMQFESSGIDTTAAMQYLQKAEIALEGKNFTSVGKFLKIAKDWSKKAEILQEREKVLEIINHSDAIMNYIKENIKELSSGIGAAEKHLSMAKNALKGKKYSAAEKSANSSKAILDKIRHPKLNQFHYVFKALETEAMINSVRTIISDHNKKNIDTQEIKTFLKKAEFAFESAETYEKGKDYIIEAKLRAREATRKYESKIASKYISTAQSQIISVKRTGVNIVEAEKYLEKAKIAFKAQEFQKSKTIAEKVITALKKAKTTN